MPSAAELLEQAKACQLAGDAPGAEQLYRRALDVAPADAEAFYWLGESCLSQGKLDPSADALRQALRLEPAHAAAHNTLGTVLGRQAQFAEATACFQRALELQPGYAEACYNLAAVAVHQGRLDEAIGCWRRAVELKPDYVDAYANLAAAALGQNRLDEAAECWRQILRRRPDDAAAHNQLGAVLRYQNKLDEAAESCRRALELKPNLAGAYGNLAAVLEQQGRFDDAAACYRRILALNPSYAPAYNNLGVLLERQGRVGEAAACWRRALELTPDQTELHMNLGVALEQQIKLVDATACYRRALELQANNAEALHNLGSALNKLGRYGEAIDCWRRALELRPDFVEASCTLGYVLAQQGKYAEAKACYRQAQLQHPEQDVWRLNLVSLCPSVFSTRDEVEQYRRMLLGELDNLKNSALSFDLADLAASGCMPSFNWQFHGENDRNVRELYANLFRDCCANQSPAPSPASARRRVGIVVTDGHEPLFLKSLGGVLERLVGDALEIVIVCSLRAANSIRAAINNPVVSVLGVTNKFKPYVDAIRQAQFDLLYYWEVATDSINYFLPFLRLAPVQCTSWGIQVTSGIGELDYYISSALIEPEDAAEHYSEKLVLADTLLTYQKRVSAGSSSKPREAFGIAADRHVYLCAQQLGKFHPDFDPILAGILRRDPQGVIVVTHERYGPTVGRQLQARFAATMSDVAERIVFLPFQPTVDYLSLVVGADVLLDPLHFGGVNSSYDGFSLNKPIVTLPSRYQRGRYTLACYKKMGVSECVASRPQEYIDIAVALGTNPEFHAAVTAKIEQASGALFDDIEAVREHERIFSALIDESRAGRSVGKN